MEQLGQNLPVYSFLPSPSIRNHNFKLKFHISLGSRAQKMLKVLPHVPWNVRKVSSTLDHYLKFPSVFGWIFGRAAINSPVLYTSQVLTLTKPPNKLLPSQPLKMLCFLRKVQPCWPKPVITGEMCRLMTLDGVNHFANRWSEV